MNLYLGLYFRFGLPDPWLKREYDMKLKLGMSSVRYTHTNRFQMEVLGFALHFFQLQDILGRMRAASAGKKVRNTVKIRKVWFEVQIFLQCSLITEKRRALDGKCLVSIMAKTNCLVHIVHTLHVF